MTLIFIVTEFALFVGAVVAFFTFESQRPFCWLMLVATLLATVWCLTTPRNYPYAVINSANAGYHAWRLWNDRNRKDRKPSKVLGKVRDLGHRLTVEPQAVSR